MRGVQPSSARSRAANCAIQSTVISDAPKCMELRADVHVQALGTPAPAGRARRASSGGRPNFEPWWAGLHRLVRVGLDPRRHAHEEARRADGPRPVELVERVEHDQRAESDRAAQISSSSLLFPWITSRSPGMPARSAKASSPSRRDVGAEPLLGEQAQDRERRERLRPEDDERPGNGSAVGARPAPGSSPRRRRQAASRTRRASSDAPTPPSDELAVVDADAVGQQVGQRMGHVRHCARHGCSVCSPTSCSAVRARLLGGGLVVAVVAGASSASTTPDAPRSSDTDFQNKSSRELPHAASCSSACDRRRARAVDPRRRHARRRRPSAAALCAATRRSRS